MAKSCSARARGGAKETVRIAIIVSPLDGYIDGKKIYGSSELRGAFTAFLCPEGQRRQSRLLCSSSPINKNKYKYLIWLSNTHTSSRVRDSTKVVIVIATKSGPFLQP